MKRIVIVVLLSLIGPGLGQLYNKEYKKGALLIFLSAALFILPLLWLMAKVAPRLPDPKQTAITQEIVQEAAMKVVGEDKHTLNLISFAFLGFWAYAITQAYFKAKEINAAENPEGEGSDDEEDETGQSSPRND